METTVLMDQERRPDGSHVVRALLKIEGTVRTARPRTPLNLALVIDRSGSMSGRKLEAAREAAAMLVGRLAPDDVVSVVAYGSDVETIHEPCRAGSPSLARAIRSIKSGGGTNLSGGWLKGRELVQMYAGPNRANRIIVLTDGRANIGLRHPAQLAGMCKLALLQGVHTTTIGFGVDYDEDLLQHMADAGGGNTYYIERAEQAQRVFSEEIEGLASLAAQNLSVTISTTPATRTLAVHHSYPRQISNGIMHLELGDLYAREPKQLLMEMHVAGAIDEPIEIARLSVRSAVMQDDGSMQMENIAMSVVTSLREGPVVNAEVRREMLLLEAARVRREALEDQRRRQFQAGAAKMRVMAEKLARAGISDTHVREEADDFEALARRLESKSWNAADTKYTKQRAMDMERAMRLKAEAISRAR